MTSPYNSKTKHLFMPTSSGANHNFYYYLHYGKQAITYCNKFKKSHDALKFARRWGVWYIERRQRGIPGYPIGVKVTFASTPELKEWAGGVLDRLKFQILKYREEPDRLGLIFDPERDI